MASDAITASGMALAARYDPQFAVPLRPRLRRGVVLRRHGDQLLIDGTPTRHVLRGAAATDLVPRLLPLLDGRLDHVELARAAEAELADVFAAVSLLWTCGVVEEAAPSNVYAVGIAPPVADHLSRVGDSTATHPAWESAAIDLLAARLGIFGPPALVEAMLGELADTIPAYAGTDLGVAPGTTLVVVSTVDGVSPAGQKELIHWCWSQDVPLLRVDLTAATVEVGPYVDRQLSACLDCQLATSTADGGVGSASHPAQPSEPVPASRADDIALAAAIAAADLVALIGRASPVALPSRWRRINLARMAASTRSGATRPGCPLCSVVPNPPGGAPRPTGTAARYEAAVALPPRRFADLKAHQMHYKPANVALQRGHRTWPTAPRTGLPEPKWERLSGTPDGAPAAIDLDAISLLLMVGAGWRDDRPDRVQRWTASGGNIGSPTAYLVVRQVDGLVPGCYGYLAPSHELALLRGRDDRTGTDANPPVELDRLCATAPAALVMTADLARVAHKYGAFGLRVALLDGGCAQATILAVAAASGVACRPESTWDDTGVAALLGLDPLNEPITGLLRLDPTVDGQSTVDTQGGQR